MTSTIKLYKVDFDQSSNCRVDDFENYLETKLVVSELAFQYVKNDLNVSIKLDLDQSGVNYNLWNYVSIFNEDDEHLFYYFITDSKWIAQHTVQLILAMDTVNTFWNQLEWKNTTHITRQHKDRFSRTASSSQYLKRIVDKEDEGVNPPKYLSTENRVQYKSNVDLDFYLIYKTEKPLSEDDLNNPLRCYLCANERISIQDDGVSSFILASDYFTGQTIYFTKQDNPQLRLRFNSRNYDFNNNIIAYIFEVQRIPREFRLYSIEFSSGDYLINATSYYDSAITVNSAMLYRYSESIDYNLYDIQNFAKVDLLIDNNDAAKVKSINDIDRTDSSIMKIVMLPYPPVNVYYSEDGHYYSFENDKPESERIFEYDSNTQLMKLKNLDAEFLSNVANTESVYEYLTVDRNNINSTTPKNIKYESKLYNSNLFTLKYQYDDQSKEFLLERWHPNSSNMLLSASRFKPSNTMNSKFIFTLSSPDYAEMDYKTQYLLIDRDNSLVQYNNDYLNYMRNGYNFDKEKKQRDEIQNLFGIAKTGIVAGITKGNALSIASTVLQQASNVVFSSIDAEQNILRKRQELSAQAGSVTNSDVDLLKYTTDNRLVKLTYTMSDQMKQAMWNLFYLTGYACNEYTIPEFNSRLHFNFVQCEPEFKVSEWNYKIDYLNDIKDKFAAGLTVYHKVNNTYDFDHVYENFESWLI